MCMVGCGRMYGGCGDVRVGGVMRGCGCVCVREIGYVGGVYM